jgi:hypothetical protein
MAIAIYNAPSGALLPKFQKAAGIQLNTGNNVSPFWTVFGKVVFANPNSSPVNVQAQLVATQPAPTPPAVLDITNVTILPNSSQSISLEGVTPIPTVAIFPMCVEIIWQASLPANVEFPRLIAISVNPATVVTC